MLLTKYPSFGIIVAMSLTTVLSTEKFSCVSFSTPSNPQIPYLSILVKYNNVTNHIISIMQPNNQNPYVLVDFYGADFLFFGTGITPCFDSNGITISVPQLTTLGYLCYSITCLYTFKYYNSQYDVSYSATGNGGPIDTIHPVIVTLSSKEYCLSITSSPTFGLTYKPSTQPLSSTENLGTTNSGLYTDYGPLGYAGVVGLCVSVVVVTLMCFLTFLFLYYRAREREQERVKTDSQRVGFMRLEHALVA